MEGYGLNGIPVDADEEGLQLRGEREDSQSYVSWMLQGTKYLMGEKPVNRDPPKSPEV